MLNSHLKLLLLLLFVLVSCTRKTSSDGKVRLQLPTQAQLSQALKIQQANPANKQQALSTSPWGVPDPTTLTEINCFAVFFQGIEPENQGNVCSNASGATVAKPGDWFGGFAPGETVQVEVPSGTARTLSIVGFKTTTAAACQSARTKLDPTQFSSPLMLGSQTQDLIAGDNSVTILISLAKAVAISKCTGPSFDTVITEPSSTTTTTTTSTTTTSSSTTTSTFPSGSTTTTVPSTTTTTLPSASTTTTSSTIPPSTTTSSTFPSTTTTTLPTHPATTFLQWVTQPSGGPAGVAWSQQPVLQIVDSGGTVVSQGPDAVAVVTVSLAQGTGTLSGGSFSVVAVGGVVDFTGSGLNLNLVGTDKVLRATKVDTTGSGGSPSATSLSNLFPITNGTPAKLVFATQPGSGAPNSPLPQQPVVRVEDNFGNPALSFAGTISLTIGNNPSSAVLGGTSSVNISGAQANFTGLGLSQPGTGFTLIANSTGLISATSAPFDIAAPNPLTLSSPIGIVSFNSFAPVIAAGGVAPYHFSILSGSGAVNESGIFFANSPTGSTTVRVTDANNVTADLTFSLSGGAVYNSISAGDYNGCAIAPGGALKCWGWNVSFAGMAHRLPYLIDSGTYYSKVSSGYGHNCAITTSGVLKCFGSNSSGQLGNGTTSSQSADTPSIIDSGTTYIAVSAGNSHTCGITSGNVLKCWGNNMYGQLGDGSTTSRLVPTVIDNTVSYAEVAVGSNHTCAITMGGELKCWGVNDSGQLGNNTGVASSLPVSIDTTSGFAHLSAKGDSSCAINSSQTLECWGYNGYGQLGDGTSANHLVPTSVASGNTYTSVAVGQTHTCAITSSGSLNCWGGNGYGQLGNGSTNPNYSPLLIDSGTTYTGIAVGYEHTCGLTSSGTAKCWGHNNWAQLGDGADIYFPSPMPVRENFAYSKVSTGTDHSCAIRADGYLECWGQNAFGQLGIGNTNPQFLPVMVDSTVSYSEITVNGNRTCGITTAGVLKCWGSNYQGEVGDGTTTVRWSPVVVDAGVAYTKVRAGYQTACGITTAGVLKCWGNNWYGQIGDGTTTNRSSPTVVDPGVSYLDVGVGANSACGLTTSNVVKCWGNNDYSQLGIGSSGDQWTPVTVGSGYNSLAVGDNSACAIQPNGTLQCWGWNVTFAGVGSQAYPYTIDSAVTYASVSVGYGHVCGMTTANKVKCFGSNDAGQLGNGNLNLNQQSAASPLATDSNFNYVMISAGTKQTCGITSSNLLRCWGDGSNGQLGNGIAPQVRTLPNVPIQ